MPSGQRFEGHFKNNKRHGEGTVYLTDGSKHYCQTWESNKAIGGGVLTNADGWIFSGEFITNGFTGKGKLEIPLKGTYDGDFKDGKFCG